MYIHTKLTNIQIISNWERQKAAESNQPQGDTSEEAQRILLHLSGQQSQ